MSKPVIDGLMNHRSIRRFKSDPVPAELLGQILRADIRAASAGNLQTYSLVVIDAPSIKR